jgi:hypothetical protein
MAEMGRITPESELVSQGATIRPRYVERNPPMWAVGETDMIGLSIASGVANVSFAIGSFCLGLAVDILITYAGTDKLTEVGSFMLHTGTWLGIGFAIVFYAIGGAFLARKGTLWKQIKSESRQVSQ